MRLWTALICTAALTACALPEMPDQDEGAKVFAENCTTCHGADARGTGIAAAQLSKAPPDLTRIALRNNGTFPRARILSEIDGYSKGAHVGRVMPEFGAIIHSDTVPLDIDGTETPTPRHLAALLQYLEAIQG